LLFSYKSYTKHGGKPHVAPSSSLPAVIALTMGVSYRSKNDRDRPWIKNSNKARTSTKFHPWIWKFHSCFRRNF